MDVTFSAELWKWDARREDGWVFVSLPDDVSAEIRDLTEAVGPRRGFGSLRVEARIGADVWRTSIFPSKDAGYVLPVKKPVRRSQRLDVGDTATVTVAVLDL